ncbi:MAG TPA: hypothetical protein VJ890_00740 [Vineibacter sp.]|nr:hypothetical protein [Vineibacter sp.]
MPADPVLAALKSAIVAGAAIDEGSAWRLAGRLQQLLDAAGFRIVGARTPELAEARTSTVSLAAYQQILGDRNAERAAREALAAKLEGLAAELKQALDDLERVRAILGEEPGATAILPMEPADR